MNHNDHHHSMDSHHDHMSHNADMGHESQNLQMEAMSAMKHDMSGHDMSGHDMSGHGMSGHDMSGHDMSGHDMSGHDMGSHEGMGHSMSMTFHGGYKETILFSWWKVMEVGPFAGSFIAIFIMALLYEGLKYYRKHLLWKTYNGLQYCAVATPDKAVANVCVTDEPQVLQPTSHLLERNAPSMLSAAHIWQTALHGLQVLVSYMLMLVFMTYNTYLCAAVVLGSATGYFLFGWRESVVVDFTEHCH